MVIENYPDGGAFIASRYLFTTKDGDENYMPEYVEEELIKRDFRRSHGNQG